jgi:NADH-quinone oxidoreductase subunit J
MTVFDFAFYMFAVVTVAAGLMVTISRNPVHSVLWLILAFLSTSGLFVLLGAEFVAMLLVIVYVGAVAVLFLFVVMMLDINVEEMRVGFWKHFPLAALLGALIGAELIGVLWVGYPQMVVAPEVAQTAMHALDHNNTRELGKLMYSEYLFPVEIAAVVLLVAMIAAIGLTLRGRKDSKAIDPSIQVKVRAADRLEVVSLPVTRPANKEQA